MTGPRSDTRTTAETRFEVTITTRDGRGVVEKRPTSAHAAERLRAEIDALTEIRHPQVVEIVEESTTLGGQPCLSTWLAGRQTLASRTPRDATEVAELGVQLASLVDELHSFGRSHGSLRPEHVIVGRGGRLVLCSFGNSASVTPGDGRIEADRRAVVEVLSHLADAAVDRHGMAGLERVLDRARRSPVTLRRLAEDLAALNGTRPQRPRRSPATPRPRSTALPIGSMGRLAVCLLAAVVLAPNVGTPAMDDPVNTARTLLAWVALGLAAYGAVANLVVVVAHFSRSAWWQRLVERMAPPKLLWIATGVATVGALTTPRRVVETPTADTAARSQVTTTLPPGADPRPVPPPPLPPEPAPTPPTPAPQPSGDPVSTWTVRPGDHLWRIAERTLAEAWAREPTDAEIDPYWRDLIDLNRKRLRDAANPDRIFPGQVFELPPVPPPRR